MPNRFDPHDYFDIRHHRAVCPVHGKRDRNLEIKRHKREPKWVFNCHSHHCTLKDIASAAGFNPADIYDNDRDADYINPTDWVVTQATARQVVTKAPVVENPCNRLVMVNDATGDEYGVPCMSKRCSVCGPIMCTNLHAGIDQLIGEYGYIHRFKTREELDQALATAKKRGQRSGDGFDHLVVGADDYYGHLVVTTAPIVPNQALRKIADWAERITDAYRSGFGRLRRTKGFRVLSRVPIYKRKSKSGQPSMWHVKTAADEYAGDTYGAFLDDMEAKEWFSRRDRRLREMRRPHHAY